MGCAHTGIHGYVHGYGYMDMCTCSREYTHAANSVNLYAAVSAPDAVQYGQHPSTSSFGSRVSTATGVSSTSPNMMPTTR